MQLATVMGGINTAHLYVVPSFNNDGVGQAANQRYNPGHSYSRDYENFGSGRVRILGAGSSTTEVCVRRCKFGERDRSRPCGVARRSPSRSGSDVVRMLGARCMARPVTLTPLMPHTAHTRFRSYRPSPSTAAGSTGSPGFHN